MRDDDLDILKMIKESLGNIGKIRFQKSNKDENTMPGAYFEIIKGKEISKFIEFFGDDCFHAKKKNDYIIWKRAFLLYFGENLKYCHRGPRNGRPIYIFNQISIMKHELENNRRYGDTDNIDDTKQKIIEEFS